MKCSRPLCQNISNKKFCGYHRCAICQQQKSSNEEYCRLCKDKLDKMHAKKEPSVQIQSVIKDSSRSPMDMMKELVGMEDVKKRVYGICRNVICTRKQRERGIILEEYTTGHFVITGNPGTGKTTIAQMMGKILCSYGVIKSPVVHVFQREMLVAAYVGQTAIKTKSAIEGTHGGICFIDEAYRLSSCDSGKDFGPEAIEEIMKWMTEEGYLFIFAGYPMEMKRFIETNPGIQRRITHRINIRDYTYEEIADIFIRMIVKSGLNTEFVRDDVVNILKECIDREFMSKYNAALASRLFSLAITAMNESFSLSQQASVPTTLTIDHIRTAIDRI